MFNPNHKRFSLLLALFFIGGLTGCVTDTYDDSAPSDSSPEVQSQGLTLETASVEEGVQGTYRTDGTTLRIEAWRAQDMIHSTIANEDGLVLTELSFPTVDSTIVPEMANRVSTAANEARPAVENSELEPAELAKLYDELAQVLFESTENMGENQIRYALMYHTSVAKSVVRLQEKEFSGTVCTANADYAEGGGMFRCHEDIEPVQTIDGAMQDPRLGAECLEGGDLGCCGNYGGCCWYSSMFCLAHDVECMDCAAWHCGWACEPE